MSNLYPGPFDVPPKRTKTNKQTTLAERQQVYRKYTGLSGAQVREKLRAQEKLMPTKNQSV